MAECSSEKFPWRLFLLAAFVYLAVHWILVGCADIGGSSEAREAHIISQVVEQGEWILPRRNGNIPSKPPLFHWTGAFVAATMGGVSELSVRAASVLYGLLTILCAGLITFRISSWCSEPWRVVRPQHTALIASGVLSLTYGFHQMSCQAMVDMTYTFCVWAALTALVWCDVRLWLSERRVSGVSLALFWIFCGLSVLARGPLGPILPLLVAGTAALLAVGPLKAILLFLRPSIGWLFFAVPLAWYLLAYDRGGEAFLERQLFFENVKRVTGGENINTEAWWFYGPSLLRTTLPWGALALLMGVLESLKGRGVSRQGLPHAVLVAPLLCLLSGIALLSLASGKRHSYLLPLMPLVAIEVALIFAQVRERKVAAWSARMVVAVGRMRYLAAGLLVGSLVAAVVFIQGRWHVDPVTAVGREALLQILLPGAFAALVGLLVGVVLPRGSGTGVVFQAWAALFTLMALIVACGSTLKASFKGFRGMSDELRFISGNSGRLVVIKDTFDEYFDPILYYLHQPVRVQSAAVESFQCDERDVYFTHAKWFSENRLPDTLSLGVLGTVRERRATLISDSRREVVVFRCRQRGSGMQSAIVKPLIQPTSSQ